MTEIDARGGGAGTGRWLKLVLIVSLAINVIVVGLYAGHLIKPESTARGADNQIRWIIKLVPEARRDFTKEHFRGIRDDMRAASMKRGEHMDAIVAAIRAEQFSAEGLEQALQSRRDGSQTRKELVQRQLVTLLDAFTAEERAEFADNLDVYLAKMKEKRARNRSGG